MRVLRYVLALLAMASQALHAEPVVLLGDEANGTHYFDVRPEVLAHQRWLAMYADPATPGVARLQPVHVEWHRMPDEPPLSVHRLEVHPSGARLLFAGVPGISAGPVLNLGEAFAFGHDARVAAFRIGDRAYELKLNAAQEDLCDAIVTLGSAGRAQTLFDIKVAPQDEAFDCDGPHFEVHWAGDLDRDGLLDLVVNFSRKYSYFPRQLLLSSAARDGQMVGVAARYVVAD